MNDIQEHIEVYDIADELIIIPKAVIDIFLKTENPAELIALYNFYYYTAKWQKTNQPKCSINYAAKGLHWKPDRIRKIKKNLIDIGLVKDIKRIDEKTHKITGWYVKLNYIFKRETITKTTLPPNPEGGSIQMVENGTTNALSSVNLNALSNNNLNALSTHTQAKTPAMCEAKPNPYELLEYYNKIATSLRLPLVMKVTPSRAKKLNQRLSADANFPAHFRLACDKIKESDFLQGKNGGWKISFDWLINNDKNYLKVCENTYGGKKLNHAEQVFSNLQKDYVKG